MRIVQKCDDTLIPGTCVSAPMGSVFKAKGGTAVFLRVHNGFVDLLNNRHYPDHTGVVDIMYDKARLVLE